MVVSAHPLASEVGVAILKKGGNAIDAAIATQLALAVVYPQAGNIGGGGFLIARLKNGRAFSIDFREIAPAASSPDMYLDSTKTTIPGKSLNGALAAGVPGTIDGIFTAYRYAKLPFATLIQPAIDLASKGFSITKKEAQGLNQAQTAFKRYNKFPVAFQKKKGWKEGDTLRQPELAKTLTYIQDKGRDGFYKGEVARAIVKTMKQYGGIITGKDLEAYNSVERRVALFSYRNYQIITMPLPSSAEVMLPQMFGMLSVYPVKEYGFQSLKTVHLMAEIERRSYADRATYLGDPAFVRVPVDSLTATTYLLRRMHDFSWDHANKSSEIAAGNINERMETTHLSVIDSEGNAVSVTTTLNGSYGCHVVVPGAGFLLNNEMDDFSIKPGTPNTYGAIGGKANAIASGKRMLSSMSPTIVLKEGKPFLVLGSPGGTTITTSVFQVIVNVTDFGMNLPDAVNAPRFHHQWQPDYIRIEPDFPPAIREKLEMMGYTLKEQGYIGRVDAILIQPDGLYEGVGDKRGDDSAAGY